MKNKEPRPMNCPNCHTQITSVFAQPIALAGDDQKAVAFVCEKCEAVLTIQSPRPVVLNAAE